MNIDHFISEAVSRSVEALYGPLGEEQLQIQKTRKEFDGDYTLVVFPLLRRSRKSPEATAAEIGEHLTAHMPEVKSFNVIKGFLNLALSDGFWADRFAEIAADGAFGQAPATGRNVMIEYSSPNTNIRPKPPCFVIFWQNITNCIYILTEKESWVLPCSHFFNSQE